MKLIDSATGITIDNEFSCASAGQMRLVGSAFYEIDFQPETIPLWFQNLLDELFDGAGVPKEYMSHIRVSNTSQITRHISLRFLLSSKGSNYMYPPWWIQRATGEWTWIPSADLDFHPDQYVDCTVELQAEESVRIASAPYETPEAICLKAQQIATTYDMWNYREIGTSTTGRPIPLLETAPRPIKILVDATMQSCEPVSWGIMHVAHWLTLPTARVQHLLDHIQFCLLPITNPDGVSLGRSVTNANGEVPKFGINSLVEGGKAPQETTVHWNYLVDLKADASIEVHAHFTHPDFTRSIGMHDKASMPVSMQAKAAALERAIEANYHSAPLTNRKVLIDPRLAEHNVYGDRYVNEYAGTIRTFLQAIPDSIASHSADVREMVETVAMALIQWKNH